MTGIYAGPGDSIKPGVTLDRDIQKRKGRRSSDNKRVLFLFAHCGSVNRKVGNALASRATASQRERTGNVQQTIVRAIVIQKSNQVRSTSSHRCSLGVLTELLVASHTTDRHLRESEGRTFNVSLASLLDELVVRLLKSLKLLGVAIPPAAYESLKSV